MDDSETSKIDTEPDIDTGMASSLGRQMAKGAAWMVFMQIAIRVIGVISMVILARLLVPADFGLIALAMMVYGLIEVFGQFGFDVVLIQNQQAGRQHYDTAWTLTVIRNTVIAGILVAGAPLAASFFDEPRLQAIFYWLAAAAFVEGFANIGVVNFRKDLEFHKDFVFMVGAKLGTFAIAVPLAFAWQNYWALVAGIVAGAFIRVALGYAMQPYRPRASLAAWREIMSFSKWLLLNNVSHFVFTRADTFIIGKISGAQLLGLYSIAYEISNLPTSELLAPIRRAIYPGYAKLGSRPEVLRENFVETLAMIVAIALPVAVGIGLIADPLVRVALGDKWIGAIPIIQILAIYGVLNVCSANIWPVYLALGKPELYALVMGTGAVAVVPLLLIGTNISGIIGAAWAITAASSIMLALNSGLILRVLSLSIVGIYLAIWRTFAAAAVMAIFVLGLQFFWPAVSSFGANSVLLFTSIFWGAVFYFGAHLLFWRISGSPRGVETSAMAAVRVFLRRLRENRSV